MLPFTGGLVKAEATMDKPLHPFRIANFRAYWLSRFTGTIAISAMSIVIGWQVYNLARLSMGIKEAAFLLGMIGFSQFVPLFLLTPITGLVADSFDRRWIVRITTMLLLATAATLGYLTWADRLSLVALFGAAVVFGVARAFSGPAYSALAPNLVPRESLPTAIAVSSIAWQVGTIAGPSVGGLLYAIHPDIAYAAATILFAVALAMIFMIGPVPQPAAQKDHRPLARIVEGFTYVRRNRLVLATITLDLFAVLLAGATALLPVYARDILKVGSQGLGILAAGMGIGAATTAIWFSVKPMTTNVGVKMLAAVVFFGLVDPHLRPVAPFLAESCRPDRRGRRGHGVGLCPPVVDPAPHARRDAGAGERGLAADDLRLQRVGRVRKRAARQHPRSRRRSGVRRRGCYHGHVDLGASVSGTPGRQEL